MKKLIFVTLGIIVLVGCAPVLNRSLMDQGERVFSLNDIRSHPDDYKGRLFILGGIIVNSKLTEQGTQIEALYAPVDSRGYLRELRHLEGRFLAVYPRSHGFLDPLIYKKGREVTLAGDFIEVRKAKLDEVDYAYPVFEIRQIYLWEEQQDYYYPYYTYPYYPYYPYGWYDPWWRPYPYWGPAGPPPPGWR